MKRILIVLLLMIALNSYADDLIVTARLIKINTETPHCGILHVGSLSVYSDIEVIKGDYNKDKIYVMHACIEMEREKYAKGSGSLNSFQLNDYHKMSLTTDNVFKVEINNEKEMIKDKDYRLYYSRTVDLTRK